MSRASTLSLHALLVLIWSSTWVAIKIGLEDAPALVARGGLPGRWRRPSASPRVEEAVERVAV